MRILRIFAMARPLKHLSLTTAAARSFQGFASQYLSPPAAERGALPGQPVIEPPRQNFASQRFACLRTKMEHPVGPYLSSVAFDLELSDHHVQTAHTGGTLY